MVGSVQATYAQAMAALEAGQPDRAMALFANVVMMRPETAEAHFQIGRIQAGRGQIDKARAAFERALGLRPGEAAIWQALAGCFPPDAQEAALTAAAQALPPPAQAAAAPVLARAGYDGAALNAYRRAAKAGVGAARLPWATQLFDTCRADAAKTALGRPGSDDVEAWRLMARVEARLRHPGPARKAMARAMAAGHPVVQAHVELADALARENENAAALRVIDAAIAERPDTGILYGFRGTLRQSLGELDAARADLRRAMALDPRDCEAFRAYTSGTKITDDDPVLGLMETALHRDDLPARARWRLHFAMAKALADLGQHDAVFDHLDAANGLQRKAFPFDFAAGLARVRAQIAGFRAHLADRPGAGPGDPVLIVTGLPRSGTTLVEQILAAHSQVTAGGELPFMREAMAPGFAALEAGRAPEDMAAIGARYLTAARRRIGTRGIFTDKAIGNFTQLGPLVHALPGARLFVLQRDPRDVALSAYRNMFADGYHRFATDLYDIGRYIRLHDALIAAWQELLGARVRVVSYEALTADPEAQIPEIVADAGLSFEPACLTPHLSDGKVSTLSFAQVRQPITRASVKGWERYADRLGRLEAGLETAVEVM